ncbi:MAG: hypothetical protein NTX53_10695 [candidate division WOR-3 bacterium]|nr:hypothetical protein [candidate division WOR-3 bacterium]
MGWLDTARILRVAVTVSRASGTRPRVGPAGLQACPRFSTGNI